MHGVLFIVLIVVAFMVDDLKTKVRQIDDYHISRVNRANTRIAELEDKLSDLEREVSYK